MDPARFFAASRVLIVAGKGGVGKSTMTAALARAAALSGRSALVVRLTPDGPVGRLFGRSSADTGEQTLHPGGGRGGDAEVRGRVVLPDQALAEYMADHGLQRITRRLMSTGAIDVVTTAAPGIRDLLVLGRVKQLEQAGAADLLVLDAPAAGHAVSFLRSPAGLRDAVNVGPIATQATEVLEMLADPARCRVLLVTLAEETPVNEVVETAFALEDEIGVQLGPVIVNGLVEVPGGLVDEPSTVAATAGLELDASDLDALRDAAAFRRSWAARQREQLSRLEAELPLARICTPQLFTTDLGPEHLEVLATAITSGVRDLVDSDA
jgi:anion-transporting  ArsA/GET3 family ATPase